MPKLPGFTLARHEQASAELRAARTCLSDLLCEISRAYGVSKPVTAAAQRALRDLDILRSELDNCVFREHPERESEANAAVYYPGGAQDRAA
jgi:hypothetical protein